MGSYLADANLLLRLADPGSEQHPVATQALARLLGQGDEVYIAPQNFIEFWAVATRPLGSKWLRMDHRADGQRSVRFARAFSGIARLARNLYPLARTRKTIARSR